MSVKPTRFYSNRQEKAVAKVVNGKQVKNSGATAFKKGDVENENWLIECKTKVHESESFSIKRDWLKKNEEEAFAMRKEHSALAFDFGDGERYYIVSEREFKRLLERTDYE